MVWPLDKERETVNEWPITVRSPVPADHVVDAAAPDHPVGADCAHADGRDGRDHVTEQDHQQALNCRGSKHLVQSMQL